MEPFDEKVLGTWRGGRLALGQEGARVFFRWLRPTKPGPSLKRCWLATTGRCSTTSRWRTKQHAGLAGSHGAVRRLAIDILEAEIALLLQE